MYLYSFIVIGPYCKRKHYKQDDKCGSDADDAKWVPAMAQHVSASVCEEGSELTPLILNPNDEFSSCSSVPQWEKAHTRADPKRGHSEQLPRPPATEIFL